MNCSLGTWFFRHRPRLTFAYQALSDRYVNPGASRIGQPEELLRAGDEIRHCVLPIDDDRYEGNVGPDQWCNKVCGGLQTEHSVSGRPRQNNRLRRYGVRSGGKGRYREDWWGVGCNRVGAGYQRRRKRRGTISSLALAKINSTYVGDRFAGGRCGDSRW